MSSNLHIPKKCQYCGNAFVARTTVTKYCGCKCAKYAYKARKRAEKVQATLKEEMQPEVAIPSSTTAINQKDFLSITEASQLIGVSRWTIQRMIKRGQLKAVPFGRKHIVARFQIESLFN